MIDKYQKGKLRLPLRLKGWKNKKLIVNLFCQKKSTLRRYIKANSCDKWYLKITYGKGRTVNGIETIYNDGDYDNKKDLLYALKCFTARCEIDDYLNNFKI